MKDLVGEVTLLDLRYQKRFQEPTVLSQFIRDKIDLLCISIRWESGFKKICEFVSELPPEVPTVVGGYQATQEAEVTALVCSQPPAGRKRWTLKLLTEAARQRPALQTVSTETIRRCLNSMLLT